MANQGLAHRTHQLGFECCVRYRTLQPCIGDDEGSGHTLALDLEIELLGYEQPPVAFPRLKDLLGPVDVLEGLYTIRRAVDGRDELVVTRAVVEWAHLFEGDHQSIGLLEGYAGFFDCLEERIVSNLALDQANARIARRVFHSIGARDLLA